MDFVTSNLPLVVGVVVVGITAAMHFGSNRGSESKPSAPSSSSGSKSKNKSTSVPTPVSSSVNSNEGKPNKKKKNKNKGGSGGGNSTATTEAHEKFEEKPAAQSALPLVVAAPSSSSSVAVAPAPAPEAIVSASASLTKAEIVKEKKKAKKEEKRRAAAAAAAINIVTSSSSNAPVADATTSQKTNTIDQPHYSKESIDDFQPIEADVPSTDSNDGWSTVEVKGKNKNKQSSSELSELSVKLEQQATISPSAATDSAPSQPPTPAPAPAPVVETPAPVVPPEPAAPVEPEKPREPSPPPIPQVEKQVKVDPKKIGFIIGPKGTTLRAIETAAECSIMMPKTDRDSTTQATVTITGTATAASRGAKAVSDLASKGYSTLIAAEGFQENSISVPIKSIPDIIGRNGSTIKKIQDIYKVKLNIPDTSNRDPTITKIRIGVAGMKEEVAQAKNVIKEITQLFYSSVTHPDTTHVELDVAPETYSLIIGTKGSEIRHIQSNFKVSVHIPNSETPFEKVLIVGTAVAVEKAKGYILKMLLKHEQRAQEYEENYQSHDAMVDQDEGPHEEWMNQYTYKREVVITPQKPVQQEPSSPFINNVGVVPGGATDQDSKNSWARTLANANEIMG